MCCWEKSSFGLPLGQGQGPVYCSSASSPQEFLRWWWGCVYAANDENVYAAVSPHNSPPQLELLSQTQTPDREERKDMGTITCPYLYHWVCAWFFFFFRFFIWMNLVTDSSKFRLTQINLCLLSATVSAKWLYLGCWLCVMGWPGVALGMTKCNCVSWGDKK